MNPELLTGHTWEVVEIGGEPVELERLPSIEFTDAGRVAGSTGVNRIMGSYELDGGTLRLSQLATTMMAGTPEAMRTEARLVQALGSGGALEIHLVVVNPDTGDTVRLRGLPVGPGAEPDQEPDPPGEDSDEPRAGDAGDAPTPTDGATALEPEPPDPRLAYSEQMAASVTPRIVRADGTLRGSVVYRESVAIPVGAVVMVRLLDTSRADAPAEVIGQQVIRDVSEVPVAFEIGYDPGRIDASHAYAAAAQIVVDGAVAWHSTMHHPVLTRGAGDSATIMVARVGR